MVNLSNFLDGCQCVGHSCCTNNAKTPTMTHPQCITVEIGSTESGTNGHTSKEHTVAYGKLLEEDIVVLIPKMNRL